MKKTNLITRLLLAGVVFVGSSAALTSCGGDDTTENPDPVAQEQTVTIDGNSYVLIAGDIAADKTLDASKTYVLSGGVFVKDGATLTIPAGMTLYADYRGTSFLSIERGGKIMAEGTATEPIVMTSVRSRANSAQRGDWGGLVVNGKAENNAGTDVQGEGGSGQYGGSDDSDNSGVIKYVRIEYAGSILGTDNEMNTFSFNSVGSGTQIEYIQAYMGQDDGIEFFGGTVDLNYAVSSGSRDDSFDWTQGWRGNGTNWIVEQASDEGDRGIEADNNGDDNNATPVANPTLSKITIYSNGNNDGIILREGTRASLDNVWIDGGNDGIEIDGDVSVQNYVDGNITLANIRFANLPDAELDFDTDDATLLTAAQNVSFTASTTATGADDFTNGAAFYKELPTDIQL